MPDVTTLSPLTSRKERKGLAGIIGKVVRCAVAKRDAEDLLTEVYLAGLWHGCELMREGKIAP
jgi:hypothetical protein